MRAQGKNDLKIFDSLGLKEKIPFKMNHQYLKKLYGFVTSRNAGQDWTQKGLEYIWPV